MVDVIYTAVWLNWVFSVQVLDLSDLVLCENIAIWTVTSVHSTGCCICSQACVLSHLVDYRLDVLCLQCFFSVIPLLYLVSVLLCLFVSLSLSLSVSFSRSRSPSLSF